MTKIKEQVEKLKPRDCFWEVGRNGRGKVELIERDQALAFIDEARKDILEAFQQKSNPCMKCGSVECAVCSEDYKEIIRKRLG